MINCGKCGHSNVEGSNFCRFCGMKFVWTPTPVPPQQPPPRPLVDHQRNTEPTQPRPYAWKTDEFEVKKASAGQTQMMNEFDLGIMPATEQMTRRLEPTRAAQMAPFDGFRCPRCSTQMPPVGQRKISNSGWIVFGILMIVFLPLFWIGLLIKEDVYTCQVCDLRLN